MEALLQARDPGDTASSLERLLDRFAKTVRSRIRSHDLRRHGIDEEDVEQDIRIRLWSALQRDPGCEFSGAYVQRVVLSAVIDAMRRERRRSIEHCDEPVDHDSVHADPGRPPDLLLAHEEWMTQVQAGISALPRRRQRPVRLFLMGYTIKELSDLDGLTHAAGSKLVRRGLADLRHRLSTALERG